MWKSLVLVDDSENVGEGNLSPIKFGNLCTKRKYETPGKKKYEKQKVEGKEGRECERK